MYRIVIAVRNTFTVWSPSEKMTLVATVSRRGEASAMSRPF